MPDQTYKKNKKLLGTSGSGSPIVVFLSPVVTFSYNFIFISVITPYQVPGAL